MNIFRVLLSCTLLLLAGCIVHDEPSAHVSSSGENYAATQPLCLQQPAGCSYAYSPSWHEAFR